METISKLVWGDNNNKTTNTDTNNENHKPLTDRTVTNNTDMTTDIQGQEPVSGRLGDTSKGEPFDAGNIETAQSQTPGIEPSKDPISETSGVADTQPKVPTTEATGVDNAGPTIPTDTTTTTTTNTQGATSSELPSTTGDHGGFKAAQADIRDPDTSATTDPKVEAERKNVDDTGALDAGENPAKADGPGPRPIDEVARERGGDAAATAERKEKDAGDEDPEGKSENKGTGEKYVKTSGLAADGGDFDATKPGAGREADRLLEEKGLENPAAAAAAGKKSEPEEASSPSSPESKKEKTSLKDKIKAKLHKN